MENQPLIAAYYIRKSEYSEEWSKKHSCSIFDRIINLSIKIKHHINLNKDINASNVIKDIEFNINNNLDKEIILILSGCTMSIIGMLYRLREYSNIKYIHSDDTFNKNIKTIYDLPLYHNYEIMNLLSRKDKDD